MTKQNSNKKYWRHSYSNHNDDDWWHQGVFGYGGYTLEINPETKIISIAVCSPKDRFSRKKGRETAALRYHHGVSDVVYDGVTWTILSAPVQVSDRFYIPLRERLGRLAIEEAIEIIYDEYGVCPVMVLPVETPKPKKADK